MVEPTEIQKQVFDFVLGCITQDGVSPTIREIAAHFRWKSQRAAECHINALLEKGWLTRAEGKARSLRPATAKQSKPVFHIPLVGSIPAGFGSDREQEPEGCVTVDIATVGFNPTRNTFALRVQGDSMIGKHICDGDIVILEHGPDPRSGQIVAALIDRKSTLKTFVLKGRKPFLKAENPKFPDLVPADELMIQGVFRALIRKTRE
jgi:repressor LexA